MTFTSQYMAAASGSDAASAALRNLAKVDCILAARR
jgi:hypothetical protein